jgi:hypothetical protein
LKIRGVYFCLFTFTFLLFAAACAIPQVPSRTVYEDPVNYVRLEEDPAVLPEWPPSHHTHPAAIGPEKIRTILSGLKAREHRDPIQRWWRGETPLVPVFRDEEVALLSVQLAEALAEAKPNERVTFYLSLPQTSTKRIITSGGLYVQDSELHLVLGNWQIVYGIPAYGMIYDRRYPMRPTAAKGFDLFFFPEEAVIPVKSSWLDDLLANGKDEMVLDLNKIQVSPPTPVMAPAG